MGETKKDWSKVNEIFRKQQEKKRAKMSPEQLAEKLAEEELGKKMKGEISVRAEEAEIEEAQNPEKIATAKKELAKIFEVGQPETTQKKTAADLIAEARRRDEQLHSENLASEKAKIERRKGMSPEEGLEEGRREQQAIAEQRQKDMDAMQERSQKEIDRIGKKFGAK